MRTLAIYSLWVRRLSALLAGICAVSVFLYGILLLMAVSHAARLSGINDQLQTLTSEISAAENTYLSDTESLSPATAAAMGLIKPSSVSIVYAPTAAALSFNR